MSWPVLTKVMDSWRRFSHTEDKTGNSEETLVQEDTRLQVCWLMCSPKMPWDRIFYCLKSKYSLKKILNDDCVPMSPIFLLSLIAVSVWIPSTYYFSTTAFLLSFPFISIHSVSSAVEIRCLALPMIQTLTSVLGSLLSPLLLAPLPLTHATPRLTPPSLWGKGPYSCTTVRVKECFRASGVHWVLTLGLIF